MLAHLLMSCDAASISPHSGEIDVVVTTSTISSSKQDHFGTTTTTSSFVVTSTTLPKAREQVIGFSYEGRAITAIHVHDAPGRPVIAIGSIHGDESMGLKVVERLQDGALIPENINLWVIPTVNPDGLVAGMRGNARGVDLNRNFATDDWKAVGKGSEKYSGEAAGSELETQSIQQFMIAQQPVLVVWWHQFGNYVDEQRTVARFELIQRFSELSGLPIKYVGCGSTPCVGNATVFINSQVQGASSFVVELPRELSAQEIDRQASAFMEIAMMATDKNFSE